MTNLHSMKKKQTVTYLGHICFQGPILKLLLQALTPPLCLKELVLELLVLFGRDNRTSLLLDLLQFSRVLGWAKHHAGVWVKQLHQRRWVGKYKRDALQSRPRTFSHHLSIKISQEECKGGLSVTGLMFPLVVCANLSHTNLIYFTLSQPMH